MTPARSGLSPADIALAAAATYAVAREVIWLPDQYAPEQVAAAAEYVLAAPGAPSADAHQASYLLTQRRAHQRGGTG